VHWAAEHFDWPNMGYEELFSVNKVLNEYDFPQLELLHFLLIKLKLGQHYKGQFKITKRGAELLANPSQLLNTLVPFYILNIDHSIYSRSGEQPFGKWDVWLNVLNVEVQNAAPELELYEVFYSPLSDEPMAWRATSAFYSCVLRPQFLVGVLLEHRDQSSKRSDAVYLKSPSWPAWLQLDTGNTVKPAQLH
jgi:hypothetical protein